MTVPVIFMTVSLGRGGDIDMHCLYMYTMELKSTTLKFLHLLWYRLLNCDVNFTEL